MGQGEEAMAGRRYRPALRALVFGLAAVGVRALTMGLTVAIASVDADSEAAATWEVVWQGVMLMNPVGTILALVGFGYAAIAAHRREWGVALVLAFVLNVVAALVDVQPFAFAVL